MTIVFLKINNIFFGDKRNKLNRLWLSDRFNFCVNEIDEVPNKMNILDYKNRTYGGSHGPKQDQWIREELPIRDGK